MLSNAESTTLSGSDKTMSEDDMEATQESESRVEEETRLTLDELLDIAERGAESEWVNSDRQRRIEKHFGKGPLAKASAFLSGATFRIEESQKKALEEKPENELTKVEKIKKILYGITTAGGDKSVFNEMGRKATKVAGKLATSGTIAYASAALLASGFGAPIVSAALLGAAAGRVGYETARVVWGKERRGRVELEEHYDDYYKKVENYANDLLEKRQNLEEQHSADDEYDVMQDGEFLHGEDVNYTQLVDLMFEESSRRLEIESEDENNTEIDLVEEESDLRKNEKKHEFRSGLASAAGGLISGWSFGLLNGGKLATQQASERSAEATHEFANRFNEGKEAVSIDLDGDGFFHKVALMKDDAYDRVGQFFGYLKDPVENVGSGAEVFTRGDYVGSTGGGLEGHWHGLAEKGTEITRTDYVKIIDAANKTAQEFGNSAAVAEKAMVVGNQMRTISAISLGFLAQAFARAGHEKIKSSREDDTHESDDSTNPTTPRPASVSPDSTEVELDSPITEPVVGDPSPESVLETVRSSTDDGDDGLDVESIDKSPEPMSDREIQTSIEQALKPGTIWVVDRQNIDGEGIEAFVPDPTDPGAATKLPELYKPAGSRLYNIISADPSSEFITFQISKAAAGREDGHPILRVDVKDFVKMLRPQFTNDLEDRDREKAKEEIIKIFAKKTKKINFPEADSGGDGGESAVEETAEEPKFELQYDEQNEVLTISGYTHVLERVEGRESLILSKEKHHVTKEIKPGQRWLKPGYEEYIKITSIDVVSTDPEDPDFTIHYKDELTMSRETPVKSKKDLEKLFKLLQVTMITNPTYG